MRDIILEKLKDIEKEHEVKILYAVESGSRGWGFESKDSDYDVRFIYIHKPQWYLSIKEKRDVIELPINDLLDINGWDVRKTLTLFKRSNPGLLEWLSTPIVYGEKTDFPQKIKALTSEFFSSKSCIYHYLNMAEGNYREYLKSENVRVKKYFYVLRPLMACMWVERFGTQPPMNFEELMEGLHLDKDMLHQIDELLKIKRSGKEIDRVPRIEVLNDFIDEKIEYFRGYVKSIGREESGDIETLDELFRETLREAWEYKNIYDVE